MNSSERLNAMRELSKVLNLDNYKEVFTLKDMLWNICDEMNLAAYNMERNPCRSSGMCACTGQCMKPEAKVMLDNAEKIRELSYKIFKV